MNWMRPLKLWLFSLIGRPRCDSCGDRRATTSRTLGSFDSRKEWTWRLCGRCAEWVDARWPHLITERMEATR